MAAPQLVNPPLPNLNASDLANRIANMNCCIGTLANQTALEYFCGQSCADRDLETLEQLTILEEILEEYKPISNEVLSTGSLTITSIGNLHGNFQVFVNGVAISSILSFTISTGTAIMAAMAANINSLTGTILPIQYTAISNGPTLTISGLVGTGSKPNGYLLTSTGTGTVSADITKTVNMSGGIDYHQDGDQCLNESQVKLMFEQASKLCQTCFGDINKTYK